MAVDKPRTPLQGGWQTVRCACPRGKTWGKQKKFFSLQKKDEEKEGNKNGLRRRQAEDQKAGGERGIRTLGGVLPPHSLSRRAPSADSVISPRQEKDRVLAEEVGFEPTVLSYNGFQGRRLKPLGHSSCRIRLHARDTPHVTLVAA